MQGSALPLCSLWGAVGHHKPTPPLPLPWAEKTQEEKGEKQPLAEQHQPSLDAAGSQALSLLPLPNTAS